MQKIFKKEELEAIKEGLRLIVFALISAGITYAIDFLTKSQDKNITFSVALIVLKSLDKWVHEIKTGKLKNWKGLLPF